VEVPEFKYKDRLTLHTVGEVIAEIDRVLSHVETAASTLTEADLLSSDVKQWFVSHTAWVRMLYARLETIIVKDNEVANNG
jgi:hypothetical protein